MGKYGGPSIRFSRAGSAGFTLIELILVMTFLAILAGVLGITGGSSLRYRTVLRDAQGIASICGNARARAVSHALRVRIEFDISNLTYRLTDEDDSDQAAPDTFIVPTGSWSDAFTWDENVTVTLSDRTSGGSGLTYITLYPDGTADAMDVVVEGYDYKFRVTINDLTGLASLGTDDEAR